MPAALPLALMVTSSTGPPLMLNGPSLVVGAGQTRDLGSLGLAGCGDAGAVLTEAPPVPPVDGIELTAPGQPDELPETADSAAQPADQGVVTDESN